MTLEWFYVTLTAFVVWMCCLNLSMGEPFPENTMVLPSRKFLKSSAISPVSVFAETKRNNERTGNDHTVKRKGGSSDKSSVVNDVKLLYRLPPSPANLLKPDGFQFYTYNERGDMITKQMTPQEIQALIASGGPDHSNIGVQEPQKAEDILTGGKKVMDVVEKVQNVLKSAMNKPPTLTGTISNSVPEKANVEWSNILPVILAGDKHGDIADDTRYVERFTMTPTIRSSTVRNDYTLDNAFATASTTTVTLDNAINFSETNRDTIPHGFGENRTRQTTLSTLTISTTDSSAVTTTANTPTETEKFMIPVAVITAEQKPQVWRSTTQSPIFEKITEILPSANVVANVEKYNDNSNRLSTNEIDSVTSNISTVPVDATKKNVPATESVVSAIVESTTSIVYSSTGQTKPASAVADTSDTSTTSTTSNVATEQTSSIGSSKVEAPFTNESFATTPFYSPSVTPATGTDQISTGPSSVLQEEIKPSVSTSLPMELINSLSSMIGQVSEISGSSILPISTGFQGQSSHNEIIEGKNRENNSEIWKSATTSSPIDVPIKLHTTDGGAVRPSMGDTYDERIEDSVAGTASTMLPRVDQDQVTWSIPPVASFAPLASTNWIHSVGDINFTSTSTTFPDDHATPNSTLSEKYTDSTETAIIKGPLGATTNATPAIVIPVTLQTVVKPFDSMKTNSTDFKSSSKISDVIESMLETVSTEANNIRSTEPLALPNLPSEILPPKTLASGLITGYEFTDTNRNVTAVTSTDVPLTLEVQSRPPSATEISTKSSLTNNNETRTSSPVNETIYIKLVTPSNPAKEPGTFETTTTVSTTRTHQENVQVENNTSTVSIHEIPTTDSSVSGVATDRTKVSSSENIHYTTTVSSKESSVLFDSKQSISHGTTNVDESTDEPSSIIAKLDEIPLEAFKKDDTTSVTDSDGLDGISSTESIVQVVHDTSTTFDRSSTNEPTSTDTSVDAVDPTVDRIAIVPDITVTDASILSTNKETKNSSNTTIVIPSINVPNKINSVDVDPSKNETTTESIHPLTGSNLNVPTNETDKFESLHSSATNTTDDGNVDDKWQRITLHETVATSPTKSTTTTTAATTTSTAATATTMTTTTLSIHENNSMENETRYQTTPVSETATTVTLNPSKSTGGLDSSTKNASNDIVNFSRLCNELAFKFWIAANKGLSTGRSLALSPFGMVSLLAMIFLGARGSTSDQMNEVLGLDNVVTFNPHLIFQNVTDAVSLARNQGIANAAFVRELFADKVKIRKLLPFYKEQAHQFYEGLVAEVNFATISDLARRRTNLLIRKQTGGRIRDFVKSNAVPLRSPLAAISANVFQTDCNTSLASTTGRDGELYFAVSSAHRLRKLIPVPATVWRSNVLAGYEPSLDATAIGLGGADKLVSTIFLLPGQQGHAAPGDTLDRLEQRLIKGAFRDDTWNKLLKVLIPRRGLELQIPKFSHRSVVNATAALKRMGLDRLFSNDADFKGINGIGNRLFLSDIVQMNLFSTCGDENTANGRHHVEIYPASPLSRESLSHDYQHRSLDVEGPQLDSDSVAPTLDFRAKNHPRTVSTSGTMPGVSEKQTEDRPRLKLDQPFLYFVRHNPTGLILHMGRFNPRLL